MITNRLRLDGTTASTAAQAMPLGGKLLAGHAELPAVLSGLYIVVVSQLHGKVPKIHPPGL